MSSFREQSIQSYFNKFPSSSKKRSILEVPPNEFIVMALNRRLIQQKYYIINPIEPILFGQPLMVIVNQDSTGRELYEEIWMKIRFFLELSN